MLGLGALGQFPLGGGPYGTATVTTIGWYAPLSEPVRFKRAPRAAVAVNNQTFAFNPRPFVSFGWFGNLSEPTRRKKFGLPPYEAPFLAFNPRPFVSFGWFAELSKPQKLEKRGLRAAYQQTLTLNPLPRVSFGWFGNLSDPVRIKPGLKAALQRPFTTDTDVIPVSKLIQWYANLSEPVRIKPGLKSALQQFLASPSRLIPTPTSFGVLDALETKDTFLAGAMLWNRPTNAEIGVINTTPQPAEIGLYQTAPTAGTITVRISIIIG
jgi:hypothetical protein